MSTNSTNNNNNIITINNISAATLAAIASTNRHGIDQRQVAAEHLRKFVPTYNVGQLVEYIDALRQGVALLPTQTVKSPFGRTLGKPGAWPVSTVVETYLIQFADGMAVDGSNIAMLFTLAFDTVNNTSQLARAKGDHIALTFTRIIDCLLAYRPASTKNSAPKLVSLGMSQISALRCLTLVQPFAHGLRDIARATARAYKPA